MHLDDRTEVPNHLLRGDIQVLYLQRDNGLGRYYYVVVCKVVIYLCVYWLEPRGVV